MGKFKVYEAPPEDVSKKPSRIVVESWAYISFCLIVRDAQGATCKPWAVLEGSTIKGRGGRTELRDFIGLKSHQDRALPTAQEKVEELASKEQQGRLL